MDEPAPEESRLWYRRPAAEWLEALPVGNGRLGAMVFGDVARERIQLNEETVWSGNGRDATSPEALDALPGCGACSSRESRRRRSSWRRPR